MTSSDEADIRVVGTGSIGRQYLESLSAPSRHKRIAVSVSGRTPQPFKGFTQVEPFALIDRPAVDLVVIASRTSRHVTDALAFRESAHRVLIEKPLATSPEEAMVLLAGPAGPSSPMYVASPLRFLSGFSQVRNQLPSIGPIHRVRISCLSWLPEWRPATDYHTSYSATEGEGGVLRDLVHEVDYAMMLFGLPLTVRARLGQEAALGIPVEAHADMLWRYPDFAIEIQLSFGSHAAERRLVASGRDGQIRWDLVRGTVELEGEGLTVPTIYSFPDDLSRPKMLKRQLDAALASETDTGIARLEDGVMALHLIDLARRSDRRGSSEMDVSGIATFTGLDR